VTLSGRAHVSDYLKEEIAAEALTQAIPAFAEFLRVAALTSSELLNYTNMAREAGISAKVVRSYFDILEDTYLGFRLRPWQKAKKRRLIDTEKFYLFDVGVTNHLARRHPQPGSNEFGKSFEHYILMELRAYQSYRQPDLTCDSGAPRRASRSISSLASAIWPSRSRAASVCTTAICGVSAHWPRTAASVVVSSYAWRSSPARSVTASRCCLGVCFSPDSGTATSACSQRVEAPRARASRGCNLPGDFVRAEPASGSERHGCVAILRRLRRARRARVEALARTAVWWMYPSQP
jgi:hypothetical protein